MNTKNQHIQHHHKVKIYLSALYEVVFVIVSLMSFFPFRKRYPKYFRSTLKEIKTAGIGQAKKNCIFGCLELIFV